MYIMSIPIFGVPDAGVLIRINCRCHSVIRVVFRHMCRGQGPHTEPTLLGKRRTLLSRSPSANVLPGAAASLLSRPATDLTSLDQPWSITCSLQIPQSCCSTGRSSRDPDQPRLPLHCRSATSFSHAERTSGGQWLRRGDTQSNNRSSSEHNC